MVYRRHLFKRIGPGDAIFVHHGPGDGLSPVRHQSITWTKCCLIVHWKLKDIIQWNLNQNAAIFVEENAVENVVCKNSANSVQWYGTAKPIIDAD